MKTTASQTSQLLRAAACFLIFVLLLSACSLPKIQLPVLGGKTLDGDLAAVPGEATDPTATAETAPDEAAANVTGLPDAAQPDGLEDLTGLVLFTSLSNDPFALSDEGRLYIDPPMRHLWAISPDGARTGRISPERAASALVPSSLPEGKPLVLANGFEANSAGLDAVPLPEPCQDPGAACSDFAFGLQGRTYAYLSGEDSCGRTLTLVERGGGQVLKTWSNVAWYRFNQDGGLLLSIDDCSRRYVYQYIPNTDTQSGISPDGDLSWDPTLQAALVQVKGESPVLSALWGFNLETSRAILWPEQGKTMQDTAIWLSDGRHFVYQHRVIRYDKGSGNAYLDSPRQIILMDAWTRAQQLIAFDGGYDYHLCQTEGEPCLQNYGDWLKVTRTPYQPGGLQLGDPAMATKSRCALYGYDCMQPAEEFAINWTTGEILPWADVLPASEPASAKSPPDPSRAPVYLDPDGAFALFTGMDGHSLWYVPSDGEPVLWVTSGEDFVYIP